MAQKQSDRPFAIIKTEQSTIRIKEAGSGRYVVEPNSSIQDLVDLVASRVLGVVLPSDGDPIAIVAEQLSTIVGGRVKSVYIPKTNEKVIH